MSNPFEGMGDDEKEYQKVVSDNVNKRMEGAMNDLKKKYSEGRGGDDMGDDGPTGDAYQKHQQMQKKRADAARAQKNASKKAEAEMIKAQRENMQQNDQDESSDDEYDDLLEELDADPEMEALRAKRISHMRQKQIDRAENLAKGHGSYRIITQDEFLNEVTTSKWVALHFFHKEFERCKIMHHHLELIAPIHIECKFINIDAEKCPFFVSKLQVRTLPTLVIFRDGVAVDRLTGFQEMAVDPSEPDKWHTSKLQAWIASTGAITFAMPTEEIRKEMEKMGITPRGTIWSTKHANADDEDED
ncbi:hypothetical protein TrST_g7002 [Triparma strigata]|uniref:Thioredoxin domain-containing protein n=1 Tax=Triparma strigata TaxID=1606541 RepID=A0A9W7C8N3_9STRA|nr:hypothetical protein TrST_g7002 [Triparma strigata]